MKGYVLLLLFGNAAAFLWQDTWNIDLNHSNYVVGFQPPQGNATTVCLQEYALTTSHKNVSLHPSSDLWSHYQSVRLTHSGMSLSHDSPSCTRNDTSQNVATHNIVVSQFSRCATKHTRWKGTLLLLFAFVVAYLYLTTHQVYGTHSLHPSWSPWWTVASIVALAPLQPFLTLTLLVPYSHNNRYLLLVVLEVIVALLRHAYDPILSTVMVYAYILYLTTSRLVQQGLMGSYDWRSLYLWLRSILLFIHTCLWWTSHVIYDTYGMPAPAVTALVLLLVMSLAISRRCTWVIRSFVSSSLR